MSLYSAYGFTIKSDIVLSTSVITEKQPDITVEIDDLAQLDKEEINTEKSNCVLGELPGIAKFFISEGKKILVDPQPGINDAILRPCILGSAMAVLLQQRGFLVLHASCVAIDELGIAFLGNSGDGKSTICSAFRDRGYEILTDDVMAVRIEEDSISVIPSIPEIKLRSDSAAAIGYQAGTLSPLHPLTKKKVHSIKTGFHTQPVPLAQIYLLEKGSQNQIQTLSSQSAFIELIRHTRAVKTLKSQNLEQAHFQKCATITRNVTISKLVRKFALSELSSVMDLVEKDLQDRIIKRDINNN